MGRLAGGGNSFVERSLYSAGQHQFFAKRDGDRDERGRCHEERECHGYAYASDDYCLADISHVERGTNAAVHQHRDGIEQHGGDMVGVAFGRYSHGRRSLYCAFQHQLVANCYRDGYQRSR